MPHPIFFGELVTKAEDLAISSPVVYPEGPEGVTIVVKPTPIAGSGGLADPEVGGWVKIVTRRARDKATKGYESRQCKVGSRRRMGHEQDAGNSLMGFSPPYNGSLLAAAYPGIIGPVTMGDENSNKKRKSKWFTYIHRIATCPRHKRKTN
ncbi:hypothetical protein BGX38DRAFT_1264098 [Terfezia claveryi]|nr:hypothetical protein BGX38DRAFT_1264098 [Terfezia claveryi]